MCIFQYISIVYVVCNVHQSIASKLCGWMTQTWHSRRHYVE